MLILKQLLKIHTVLWVLMLLLFAHNLPFNVSDRRWISSILKHRKLILKFLKRWLLPKNISNLPWVMLTQLHWDKLTLKSLTLSGRISVVFNKLRNNFKKWSCSQLNIPINSWNSVCNHQRVYYSMDLQVVVKPSWQKQWLMNAVQTSFQSKVHNC